MGGAGRFILSLRVFLLRSRRAARSLPLDSSSKMLRAIIFDCDGVIADSEPIHIAALRRLLSEESITVTREEYFAHYLSFDDRRCFLRAFGQNGRSLTEDQLSELIGRKAGYVESMMRESLTLLPGAPELIRIASESYPLAVASGALKREIELILEFGGLTDCFRAIVSAEDVARSKPHPDPFLKACDLLNSLSESPISHSECLVIEDSIHGVRAAREAGMRCLAVTNSYPREKLALAHRVVESLTEISLDSVRRMFVD